MEVMKKKKKNQKKQQKKKKKKKKEEEEEEKGVRMVSMDSNVALIAMKMGLYAAPYVAAISFQSH
jgi:ribosomal protein S25